MKPMMIVGVVLIILDAVGLAFQGISYTTRKKIVDVAGIQVIAETRKTIPILRVVSSLILSDGIVVVIVASNRGA